MNSVSQKRGRSGSESSGQGESKRRGPPTGLGLIKPLPRDDSSTGVELNNEIFTRGVPEPSIPSPTTSTSSNNPLARDALRRRIQKAMTVYQYVDLRPGEMRLLVIHPEIKDNPNHIMVRLVHVNMKDVGGEEGAQYEALSYTWGDGALKHKINISMQDETKPLVNFHSVVKGVMKERYVTENLYSALKHLRDGINGQETYLWVDALCINQDNQVEKTDQISRMTEIYGAASRVCIWLGTSDLTDSDMAMDFVKEVTKLRHLEMFTEEIHAKKWVALSHLMKRSWFSRRWIIQELALAEKPTVFCGSKVVAWEDLRDAISFFVIHFDTISNTKGMRDLMQKNAHFNAVFVHDRVAEIDGLSAKILVEHTVNIFRRDSKGHIFEPALSLEHLVSCLTGFNTADPRDTVFALRNICKEKLWLLKPGAGQPRAPPQPDYDNKNLLTVYIEFVSWVIETTGTLDIICRHWALPEKTKRPNINYPELVQLPSWVQTVDGSPYGAPEDGIRGERQNGDPFVGSAGRPIYNACGLKKAEAHFETPVPLMEDPANPNQKAEMLNARGIDGQNHTQSHTHGVDPPTNADQQFTPKNLSRQSSLGLNKNYTNPALYAMGVQIDTIHYASGRILDGVIPSQDLQRLDWDHDTQKSEASAIDKRTNQPKGWKHIPDKLWRTLVADRQPDGNLCPGWYRRACLHCAADGIGSGYINAKHLYEISKSEIIKQYLRRVMAVVWNRKIIEGEKKSNREVIVGIGPPASEKGDWVCILFGCTVPVILRQNLDDDGNEYFEFIGEAYIYGKMDGEAISELGAELETKRRQFRIM